jgi:hypothetical protein
LDATILRSAREDEPVDDLHLASIRQRIESIFWTCMAVQNTEEDRGREGIYGSIEFVTGKPIPYESIKVSGPNKHPRESGIFPPAVRQRRVELTWRPAR